MRQYDQKSGVTENWGQFFNTSDNGNHKIDRYWNALYLLGSPRDSFTFQDWLRSEKIMETWYNAGLFEATGHAYGNYWQFDRDSAEPYPTGDYGITLSRHCGTINLTENDRITAVKVRSGDHGVERIDIQTYNNPEFTLGSKNTSYYAFEDTNWVRFDQGTKTFGGFYGYTDAETGVLNSLGFVEADTACLDRFRASTQELFSWASIIPGTEVSKPALPDGIRLIEPDTAGEHEHDKVASDAMLIPTIIIYVLIFICLVLMAVMHFRSKK